MSAKPAIKRNMVWNTSGLVVEIVTGFLILPFLLTKLGSSTYGVWLVLTALTGYFGLLELGVRSSIGRHIALYQSQNNQIAVNQTLTGGSVFLLGAGFLACLALIACEPLFLRFYQIPDADRTRVGLAFYLVAANFVIVLLGTAFDAALWGCQRFDWLNAVDIPLALIRFVSIFALIRSSEDIVVLASLTVAISSIGFLAKSLLYFVANPAARIGIRYLNRSNLGQLLSYGSWNVISTFARISRTQLGPILIGAILGLSFVPFFSVANRLLIALTTAMGAMTNVLAPHATTLHGTNQTERQRKLFLIGGRMAASLGAFLVSYLFAFGTPLVSLWVGPAYPAAATLLIVFALGELIPCTQYVTNVIILATARHRELAIFATLEAITVCGLMIALLPLLGLLGVGLAVAIPAFLSRGVAPMIHGCRIIGVPVHEYLAKTIIPAILCAAFPALVVRLATHYFPIETWAALLSSSMGYTLLFGICYVYFLDRTWLTIFSQRVRVLKQKASPRPRD